MSGSNNKREYEERQKRLKIIGSVLFIATIVIIIILLLKNCGACGRDNQVTVHLNYDQNSEYGQLETKSKEEIVDELDRLVEENMFNVSINATPEFIDGNSEGEICIENVPGNHFLMSVKITLDDTGEIIYQTGLIKPNYHITKAKLLRALPKGEYPATATFTAHDMETGDVEGNVNIQMTIYIDN